MADGPTLAQLAIKIENSDVIKATTSLDGMTVAGTKTEAAHERLTRRMALVQIEAQRMNAEFGQVSREMGLAEVEALKMNDALTQSAKAADTHSLSLGRLRMELGTLDGRLTGTSTVMDRMAGAIGAMALGNPVMIGVLGGVAALSLGFEYLSGKTSEAAAEAKALAAEYEAIAKLGYAAQAKRASDIYSGVGGDSVNPLDNMGLVGARQLAASDRARIKAGTYVVDDPKSHHTYKTLDQDAQAAAKDLELVNKWLEKNEAIYLSIHGNEATGRGGSMDRKTTALIAGDQPGFTTDQLAQQDKDAKEAQKTADALEKLSDAWKKYQLARAVATSSEMGQLERDRDAALALVAAEQQGTQATREQQIANEVSKKLAESHITILDAEYDKAKALIQQTVEAQFTEKDRADARKLFHEQQVKADDEDAKAMERLSTNAQKYQQDIQHVSDTISQDLLRGIEEFSTHGLDSFKNFFDGVDRMAVQMVGQTTRELETLQKDFAQAVESGDLTNARALSHTMDGLEKLKGVASGVATAVSAALSGYSIGSSSGNSDVGALGGAASGALAGSAFGPVGMAVGAVAGFVGGIIGAGNAAKEAQKQMDALRQSLNASISDIKAQIGNDSLGSAVAQVQSQFDALRKQTEDAYSGGGANSDTVKQRNAILAQLNTLEAERIKQLQDEAAQVKQYAQEDYNVRTLRATGHTAEADAMAFAEQQQREYTAAVKAGTDVVALAAAQAAEATQHQADLDKAVADAAQQQARAEEDAQLRLAQALNDPAYEAAARAAAERREIEDLIAKGASDATIALTKHAQAAEDVAKAAADAAAAQQKLIDAQRGLEDLAVRDLRAKGETAAADDLAFKDQQQREYEDAVAAKQSQDYLDALQKTLQDEATQRALNQLISSTTGPSSSYGGGSASSAAAAAVQASVTERTALTMVDLDRARNSTLDKIELNTRGGGTGGNSGLQVNLNASFHISGEFTPSERQRIVAELLDEVQEQSGSLYRAEQRFSGSVHG